MHVVISLIFIVFIPALAVLGHDSYLYYLNQDNGFMLSTMGFIWTEYEPTSYEKMLEGLTEEQVDIATAILGRKAIELTGAFGVLLSCLIIVVKLIAILFSGINRINEKSKMRRKH